MADVTKFTFKGNTYTVRDQAARTSIGDLSSLTSPAADLVTAINNIEAGDIGDLQGDVTALKTAVGDNTSGLIKDVTALKTAVGDNTSGLVKAVADNADAIGVLNGDDSTAGSVAKQIKDATPYAGTSVAGVIKVGNNLSIDSDGVLSASMGSSITVDSAIDPTSTNPVQNKAIAAALDDASDAIDALETAVGDASSGLVKAVADNASAISTIVDTDTGMSMRDVASDVVSGVPKAITPKGTIEFADLPSLASSKVGDMYNIEDAFTTTADFIEGAGTSIAANSNIYVIDAGNDEKKWDVFATGGIADMSAYQAKVLTSHTGITATTVEGALEEIASEASDNASDISDLKTAVGDTNSGLIKTVADIITSLDSAAYSVATLPAASVEMVNMVRFNLFDDKWYVCKYESYEDEYIWIAVTQDVPAIDLSEYSKNLIIDKASDITADQIAEYDTFDTTDNECGMVFGEVAEGDHNAVDGDSVYKAIASNTDSYKTVYTPTYATNVEALNDTDGVSVYLTKNGYRQITGCFIARADLATGAALFTLPSEVRSTRSKQLWLLVTNLNTGASYGIRMPSTTAYSWGQAIPAGTYQMQAALYL